MGESIINKSTKKILDENEVELLNMAVNAEEQSKQAEDNSNLYILREL